MLGCLRQSAFWTITFLVVAAPTAAGQLNDQHITRSLEQAFRRDFRLKDAGIKISTASGLVTLRGKVTSYPAKFAAERIAQRTAGVRRVVNQIQVASVLRRDAEIAADVRRRLSQTSFLRFDGLTVQVAGGVVTLGGTVPTWAQRRQAELVTAETRGVALVRNNLVLGTAAGASAAARSDEQIQADVEAELRRDAHLADLPIDVVVERAVVRLLGEVPHLFHKEHAGNEARLVANVKTVENHLVVGSQLLLEMLLEDVTDQQLEQVVWEELQADPRTPAESIEVTSRRGTITLAGSVDSMFEKQTVEHVARSVVGVVGVESMLTVNAAERGDAEVQDDVQFNLQSDSQLTGNTITVTVRDGTVHLAGEVDDYSSKFHAARLCARVRGVRAISNELKVRWSASTRDGTVQQRIVQRLQSNAITQLAAGRIRVTVREGAVTLEGAVDRFSQRNEAERIAKLTDGVRSVDNQLTLGEARAKQ